MRNIVTKPSIVEGMVSRFVVNVLNLIKVMCSVFCIIWFGKAELIYPS